MDRTMSIKEAAAIWGISDRRVNTLCKEGRIAGAYQEGRTWRIPAVAEKPADKRLKKRSAVVQTGGKRLPLPIGISDYRKASTEYYYVDKTLMIRDFIDERPQVSLFTRPRRFGKSLNMDMLRTFFEKTEEDTSVYFRGRAIWACGEEYRRYQGKFPVIYITFKDVKFNTWDKALDNIADVFRDEYDRHKELLTSERCTEPEKAYYRKITAKEATEAELTGALRALSRMLHEHYDIAPIIIIDEYDTPIQQGYFCDYYNEIILFMRNLFSGGLKDNRHLSYGFLTGILRVAKESIFSGLNNLKINSVLDNKYSQYFGFTPDEVSAMADYYGVSEKFEELRGWYDGYQFGNSEIFNPWSVISYFGNECRPQAFWQSTGSNEIISEILGEATGDTMERLESLMRGETFVTRIDADVVYPQIRDNPSSIYSFLLMAGYLKFVRNDPQFNGAHMCVVALPNQEITAIYRKEILSKLDTAIPPSSVTAIQEALYIGDAAALQVRLEKLLLEMISVFDANETFYHGLVLGLCAIMDNRYYVRSNRESGTGRFDIQLEPLSGQLPGILMELKAEKHCDEKKLEALAQAAVLQIDDRQYDTDMKARGIRNFLKYGVAFSGKRVQIACKAEHDV